MRMKRLACLVAMTVILGAGSAHAQSTEHLPLDPTVPYLPAIGPVLCPNGEHACVTGLDPRSSAHARTRSAAITPPCSATRI